MTEIHSDEERLEALQRWWRENGMMLLVTVVVVVAGGVGWQYWQVQRQEQADASAALYQRYLESRGGAAGSASASALAEQLRSDYPGSVYAAFVALDRARRAVAEGAGGPSVAREELQWVLEQDPPVWIADVARLRLARLALAEEDFAGARGHLDTLAAAATSSAAEELRGDVYLAEGRIAEARQAYARAQAASEGQRPLLQMKLDSVAARADDPGERGPRGASGEPSAPDASPTPPRSGLDEVGG